MDFTLLEKMGIHPERGHALCDVSSFSELPVSNTLPVVVTGIKTAEEVEIVRRRLLSLYGKTETVTKIFPVSQMKKEVEIRALSAEGEEFCISYDPAKMKRREDAAFTLEPILSVMKTLREEGGCPWDRAQDHATLRTYLLQEAYEVIDAIDRKDMENLKEELGDVLYQLVFHARIAEENGLFTMQDVVDGIAEKMVRRHPYVFGTMTAEETAELLGTWEARKLREKKRAHLLDGTPGNLPSILFACIILGKVGSICKGKTMSLREIMSHFESSWRKAMELAKTGGRTEEAEFFFGAALFETVGLVRFCGVDPELALHRFDRLYAKRLGELEDRLHAEGKGLQDATPELLRDLGSI